MQKISDKSMFDVFVEKQGCVAQENRENDNKLKIMS